MALVNCPNCGNPVSEHATQCPHCGYVPTFGQLRGAGPEPTPAPAPAPMPAPGGNGGGTNWNKVLVIVLVVSIILTLGLCGYLLFSSRSSESDLEQADSTLVEQLEDENAADRARLDEFEARARAEADRRRADSLAAVRQAMELERARQDSISADEARRGPAWLNGTWSCVGEHNGRPVNARIDINRANQSLTAYEDDRVVVSGSYTLSRGAITCNGVTFSLDAAGRRISYGSGLWYSK